MNQEAVRRRERTRAIENKHAVNQLFQFNR